MRSTHTQKGERMDLDEKTKSQHTTTHKLRNDFGREEKRGVWRCGGFQGGPKNRRKEREREKRPENQKPHTKTTKKGIEREHTAKERSRLID